MEKRFKLDITLYNKLVIVDNIGKEFDDMSEFSNVYHSSLYEIISAELEHDSISVHISEKVKIGDKEHEIEISTVRLYKYSIDGSYINLDNMIINCTNKYNQTNFEEKLMSLFE